MMNENNTGPGIAGEPEPAVPPEAEQTSVSLPSFIAPFPPVRPPAAFAHYRLPEGKDSGASFGKIWKLLPSGNPFRLFLAWLRDLPRRGAAVIFRRLLFFAVAFLISLGKAGILQRQVRRRGGPFVRFFRLPEEKRP